MKLYNIIVSRHALLKMIVFFNHVLWIEKYKIYNI